MKYLARSALVLAIGLMPATGLFARPAAHGSGGGGGHGGSGGHGGGHGGHGASHSGGSSGRGAGHAIGHSLGHVFGHHGKTSNPAHDGAPPLVGAAVVRGKVSQPPSPRMVSFATSPRFRHRRFREFPSGERFFFFPRQRGFGFGNCADFGFSFRRFFFNDDFDCFGGELLFDPFFLGNVSGSFVDSPALLSNPGFLSSDDQDSAAPAPLNEPHEDASIPLEAATNNPASPTKPDQRPVTLLQLRDGTMYGLTDYWVEDGQLHYTTTYGGQDSIQLDRVDMEKTAELNSGRGVEFAPRPKPR